MYLDGTRWYLAGKKGDKYNKILLWDKYYGEKLLFSRTLDELFEDILPPLDLIRILESLFENICLQSVHYHSRIFSDP